MEMVNVYNKETGALIWNGENDQVPQSLQTGDPISFVEDAYVVEEIVGNGGDRTIYVRHQKM
jgi:hypothetical protein